MRKDEIKAVAMDVFSKRGYHDASMQDIADVVGIRKAALYFHFKSKRDLYTELLSDTIPALMDRMKKASEGCPDAESALKAVFYELAVNQPPQLLLIWKRTGLMTTAGFDADIRDASEKLIEQREGNLRGFVADILRKYHGRMADEAAGVALFLFFTMVGGFSEFILADKTKDRQRILEAAEAVWVNFWHGFGRLLQKEASAGKDEILFHAPPE